MIEPVGSVAPITSAQSLSHTNLTTLGARLAAGFATELGRARADLAFTRDASVVANVLAAPARASEQMDRVSSSARLLATLDAQSTAQSRSPGRQTRVDRREGGSESHGEGDETDSDDEDDVDAVSSRLAGVPVPTIRSGLDQCRRQLELAGLSGQPVVCVFPGQDLVCDQAIHASIADLMVLCLAFDGDIGASRHVWGSAYHDASCIATFDARWSEAHDVTSGAAEPWLMSLTMPASLHAVLACRTPETCHHGLRIAGDVQNIGAEPVEWVCLRGDINWL